MEKIPVFAPSIDADTKKHITDILDAGWLGMGSATKEFEKRIEEDALVQSHGNGPKEDQPEDDLKKRLIGAGVVLFSHDGLI